jgi:two-component system, chemotaxis family, CheB/CheR fusion protein
MSVDENDPDFEELLEHLKRSRGFDFSAYKRSSLGRRVQKRMQSAGIDSYSGYNDYLEAHPQEFTQLFNTILINVTSFFRDPQMWEYIASDIVPRLIEARNGDASIRIWSAGCSSGEEAYSLAMLLADALGPDQFSDRVKIYATDVDEEALSQGRAAAYSDDAMRAVPEPMVQKYFERINGRSVFRREFRRSIIFGRHDLILDPPISRIMLLVCRNTLMYFNAEVQQRILERFHFGIHDGGFLFLGKAEMLLTRSNVFTPIDLKKRVFGKVSRHPARNGAIVPSVRGLEGKEAMMIDRLRELAFQMDLSAQVIIDRSRTVVMLNERVRSMFGLTSEDVGKPLQDLEISFRPVELRSMVEQAWLDHRVVSVKDVEWTTIPGDRVYLDVQVTPLIDPALNTVGAKIVFRDTTRTRRLEEELKHSHQELETANEELQSTNEELETTNEELQSTVEELETTNEELQSTNEELETMNEELQSTNEELQTTNEQLRQSGEELNRANGFFENILNSFPDGVIVVDAEQRVQAWNDRSEDLWGLRSDEVIGKHLMNLDIGLPTDQLRTPIRQCQAGEAPVGRISLQATNRRGRAIRLAVSCSPFALGGNPSWGTMITMEEETRSAAGSTAVS